MRVTIYQTLAALDSSGRPMTLHELVHATGADHVNFQKCVWYWKKCGYLIKECGFYTRGPTPPQRAEAKPRDGKRITPLKEGSDGWYIAQQLGHEPKTAIELADLMGVPVGDAVKALLKLERRMLVVCDANLWSVTDAGRKAAT